MAKVSNETKLVLALAEQKHKELKESRIQALDAGYRQGYSRCFEDIWSVLHEIVKQLEGK